MRWLSTSRVLRSALQSNLRKNAISSLGSEDRHFEDSLNEVVSTCGFSVTFESKKTFRSGSSDGMDFIYAGGRNSPSQSSLGETDCGRRMICAPSVAGSVAAANGQTVRRAKT